MAWKDITAKGAGNALLKAWSFGALGESPSEQRRGASSAPASPPAMPTPPVAGTPPTEADARAASSALLANLEKLAAQQRDTAAHGAFGGVAARGFIGGMAEDAASKAIGEVNADIEKQKNDIINQQFDRLMGVFKDSEQAKQNTYTNQMGAAGIEATDRATAATEAANKPKDWGKQFTQLFTSEYWS